MSHSTKVVDRALLEEDDFLHKMVDLIVEHFGPEQIYLFGSRARGIAGPDSDYDFLVVVRRKISWGQQKKFSQKRWKARLFEPVDIVYWTEVSFKEHLPLKSSLPAVVSEEGKLLYEAA